MTYESGSLAPAEVRTLFDRIAPVYDTMNRVMTVGLDQRWRRLAASSGRSTRRPRPRRVLRHRRSRRRRRAGRRHRHRSRLLSADARARAAEVAVGRPGSRATSWRCRSPTAPSTPRRSGSVSATSPTWMPGSASSAGCSDPGAGWRSSRSRRHAVCCGRSSVCGSIGSCRCSVASFPVAAPTRTSRRASAGSPAQRSSPSACGAPGSSEIRFTLLAGTIVALHVGVAR